MRPSRLLAAAGAFGLLALTEAALAQPKQDDSSGYSYRFTDDDLVGATLPTTAPLLRVSPKGRRITFLRPRASFVAEMLKSVEGL